MDEQREEGDVEDIPGLTDGPMRATDILLAEIRSKSTPTGKVELFEPRLITRKSSGKPAH